MFVLNCNGNQVVAHPAMENKKLYTLLVVSYTQLGLSLMVNVRKVG